MNTLIGDIASGNLDMADVLFLAAFILFVIAFITELPMARPQGGPWWRMIVSAALACVALAWLLL